MVTAVQLVEILIEFDAALSHGQGCYLLISQYWYCY